MTPKIIKKCKCINFHHQFRSNKKKLKEFISLERETVNKKVNYRKMSKGTGQKTFCSLENFRIFNFSKKDLIQYQRKKNKLSLLLRRKKEYQ